MTNPTLYIVNGPGYRDLELAFLARRQGAKALFTIMHEGQEPLQVRLRIFNFSFVTNQHPNYEVGGSLEGLSTEDAAKLPRHHFVFLKYNAETKMGTMEFPNGE